MAVADEMQKMSVVGLCTGSRGKSRIIVVPQDADAQVMRQLLYEGFHA